MPRQATEASALLKARKKIQEACQSLGFDSLRHGFLQGGDALLRPCSLCSGTWGQGLGHLALFLSRPFESVSLSISMCTCVTTLPL